MATLNKVQLIGYLGADPQMKFGQDTGKPYCRVRLATQEGTREKPRSEWHNLVLFERRAEVADQFLKTGSLIYVEGRIQTRRWKDQEGKERSTTEILVFNLQILDRKVKDGQPELSEMAPPPPPLENDPFSEGELPDFPDFPDDLPF